MEASVSPGLQAAYDELYTPEIREWRELGAKYKAANVAAVCRDRRFSRVLEVGAGDGSLLMHLERLAFCDELHAVEISKSGLERIRERNLGLLRSAHRFDGYTLPFPDAAFDLVILSHVLEHVEHPRVLLRELRRVAGHQVIEIPCDYADDVDERVESFLAYGHINVFKPNLLRFLLKSEDFEVLMDRTQLAPPEVVHYLDRRNGKPAVARLATRAVLMARAVRYGIAGRIRREEMASAYTVLCRSAPVRKAALTASR